MRVVAPHVGMRERLEARQEAADRAGAAHEHVDACRAARPRSTPARCRAGRRRRPGCVARRCCAAARAPPCARGPCATVAPRLAAWRRAACAAPARAWRRIQEAGGQRSDRESNELHRFLLRCARLATPVLLVGRAAPRRAAPSSSSFSTSVQMLEHRALGRVGVAARRSPRRPCGGHAAPRGTSRPGSIDEIALFAQPIAGPRDAARSEARCASPARSRSGNRRRRRRSGPASREPRRTRSAHAAIFSLIVGGGMHGGDSARSPARRSAARAGTRACRARWQGKAARCRRARQTMTSAFGCGDDRPHSRLRTDDALALQREQGLAYRRAPDAEQRHQVALGRQGVAGLSWPETMSCSSFAVICSDRRRRSSTSAAISLAMASRSEWLQGPGASPIIPSYHHTATCDRAHVVNAERAVVVEAGNLLGESPVWDPRAKALWWVDIHGRSLHCWRARSARRVAAARADGCIGLCDGDRPGLRHAHRVHAGSIR